jgi:hypothetical protein
MTHKSVHLHARVLVADPEKPSDGEAEVPATGIAIIAPEFTNMPA